MAKLAINLPTMQELRKDDELSLRQNDLMVLLNQPVPKDWIQKHPMTKQDYLPIERVEWLMSRIFFQWKVEVKNVQLIGNSVVVTVRVYYIHPLNGEWEWTEGVGASALQTDKGAGATDFNALKSASVQMAAPAAKSYAFKDACECLGKIFGKDLNRRDIDYNGLLRKEEKEEKLNNIFNGKGNS